MPHMDSHLLKMTSLIVSEGNDTNRTSGHKSCNGMKPGHHKCGEDKMNIMACEGDKLSGVNYVPRYAEES